MLNIAIISISQYSTPVSHVFPIVCSRTTNAHLLPRGLVLGRRCFEVRICACPGRDRKSEEENKSNQQSGTKQTKKRKSAPAPGTTSSKKTKSASSAEEEEKEVFVLHVQGRERFEMLKKINDALELHDKENKSKSRVPAKQELPLPINGKKLLQRGEKSDSD